MKAVALVLLVAVSAALAPVAAAENPVEEAAATIFGLGPALPGFWHTICQVVTQGNCAEGAVITNDVRCRGSDVSPECTATNCTGTGSEYRCTITYQYRVTLSGVGFDPEDLTQPPLYVNANGSAGASYAQVEGVAWSRGAGAYDTKTYSNIPVHGMDVQIPAYVCIGVGPFPGIERRCEPWTTVAIHLPPEPAAGLDTQALAEDPDGTILAAVGARLTEASELASAILSWNPVPVSVYPGTIPDPGDPGDLGDLGDLVHRVKPKIRIHVD